MADITETANSATNTSEKTRENESNGSEPAGKKTIPKRFIVVPLLILGMAGAILYLTGMDYESTDDAFIEGHVLSISAKVSGHVQKVWVDDNQLVKKGDLLVELDPRDFAVRRDQALAALHVAEARRDAARINVGLTSDTTQADLDQASSGVNLAQSGLGAAQAQEITARNMVQQARAQIGVEEATALEDRAAVQAAEAVAKQAGDDLLRDQGLIQDGAISQQDLDHAIAVEKTARANVESARQKAVSAEAKAAAARASYQAAQASLHQAESNIAQSKARIGEASGRLDAAKTAPGQVAVTRSQLQALDAEVEQARAVLRQAELDLSYTQIRAPAAGRITRKSAEVGTFFQLGQPFLAIVPNDVWVVANFKETQLTTMRPGQPASIRVDAYPGLAFKGHVDSIQAGTGARFSLLPPENATGNYVKVVQRIPVKIVFDGPLENRPLLAPGMSLEPKVKVK